MTAPQSERRAELRALLDSLHAPAVPYQLNPFAFPKRCSCCGATYGVEAWTALPLVGVQMTIVEGSDDEIADCELRNCTCKSTLAVEVDPR